MGVIFSYNPFSVEGQYNIKSSLYTNKKPVLVILVVVIMFVVGTVIALTVNPLITEKQSFNIPPPRYGHGPYGYGMYLPTRDILAAVVQ